MLIEVVGKTWYTVELTDEDVEKVKAYINDLKNRETGFPSFDMEKNICEAVSHLSSIGEIQLFDGEKATESDFITDEINWSEFEEKSAEEILGTTFPEYLPVYLRQ